MPETKRQVKLNVTARVLVNIPDRTPKGREVELAWKLISKKAGECEDPNIQEIIIIPPEKYKHLLGAKKPTEE